jgi:hypothetical protein
MSPGYVGYVILPPQLYVRPATPKGYLGIVTCFPPCPMSRRSLQLWGIWGSESGISERQKLDSFRLFFFVVHVVLLQIWNTQGKLSHAPVG